MPLPGSQAPVLAPDTADIVLGLDGLGPRGDPEGGVVEADGVTAHQHPEGGFTYGKGGGGGDAY